ncbi:hypothetical protein ACHAXA_001711 [Cyclostephanos tholiformis]|uniref:SD-repeat containing protein B domain-containing protein n=1 Tax=Cyclostephanos tholiformis TaxID=382380 RepID=A0ABD3RYC6_9STRA
MPMTVLTLFSIEADPRPSQGLTVSSIENSPPSISSVTTTEGSSNAPASQVNGMTIQRQVYDPCDSSSVLVGALVTLYSEAGQYVDETFTDSDGYYIFTGLPFVRYLSEVDYPECDGRHLSEIGGETRVFVPNDHAFKFYKSGDVCDVMLSIGDEDGLSSAGDIAHFDTLDECCANMFWFDIDGCSSRSPIAFQFEFCVDVSGFEFDNDELHSSSCPLDEISIVERELQNGLDCNSTLALVQFGNAILSKVGNDVKCNDGPAMTADHSGDLVANKLRRGSTAAAPPSQGDALTICGVVVTKETLCGDEACLRERYDKVLGLFEGYLYGDAFAVSLRSSLVSAGDGGSPHRAAVDLRTMVEVVASSLTARKLVFPSSALAVVPKEIANAANPAVTIIEDRQPVKNQGNANSTPPLARRFYPTYMHGRLCRSKSTFDSWEQSYASLRECCESHFSWDLTACCGSLDMGGC